MHFFNLVPSLSHMKSQLMAHILINAISASKFSRYFIKSYGISINCTYLDKCNSFKNFQIFQNWLSTVAHTCNPSCLEG
uniref:Uncharacterized protein n=1 Tax=Macaca fascicularis TaxID=9541 RepID=Q9GMR6_MACFA|nr:hypothetical protein [Macaca fascicularis]